MMRNSREHGRESLEAILEEFGMSVETLDVSGSPGELLVRLRVLFPDLELGDSTWADRFVPQAGNEPHDRELLPRAIGLLRLSDYATNPTRLHMRRLGSLSLWRTPSIRDARGRLPSTRLADVIQFLGQDSDLTNADLLENAVYPGAVAFSVSDEAKYLSFSDVVLEELEEFYQSLHSGDIARQIRSDVDPLLHQEIAPKERDALLDQRWEMAIQIAWPRLLRLVLSKADELDSRDADALAPLRHRAEQLLQRVELIDRSQDGWESEVQTLQQDVGAFLGYAVNELRQTPSVDKEWAESLADYCNDLLGKETAERLEGVNDLWLALLPRGGLIQVLLRETDIAPSFLVGQSAKALYRRARSFLSPAERRLFCLMYMPVLRGLGNPPTLPFGGWTLFHLPMLSSMLEDEALMSQVAEVIVLKRTAVGEGDPAKLLHRRYRRHLAFYGWWVRMIREQDSDRKRRKRKSGREVIFG